MLALDIKAESVMSIASVHAGSFDIENEKLVFRAAEKTDNVSSIFEREVERLNEYAELYEWTFVSVCANKSTVFVAVNTPPGWVLLFEINAIDPIQFEQIEDKLYVGAKHDPYFGLNASVKMICCSGEDQAAVLIIDNKEIGSVWLRIFSVQRHFKIWVKCPVDYNDREQCIVMIACGEMHCAALTTAGDVFTCIFPMSNISPKWTISGNLAAFDGGDCQRALQTIVDDMDCNFMYKTRSDPMAASFGVTGGLRNPYLLNINTDGDALDKLIEKHNNETKARTAENRKALEDRVKREKEMKEQNENEVHRIKALEEEIDNHENEGKYHKNNLEEAAKKMQEAKRLHDEAHSVHSEHETKLKTLKKQLQQEETVMGIKPVHTHIRSPNPHDYQEVDKGNTASSKTKSKGFGFGTAFRGIFGNKPTIGNKPTNSENELHFEDIAHFSASRENRCTYI